MRFSIVIPVYNTEPFLPRCLDSLRAQTDRDFEVVVVDDCSPGPCAETVRPYGDFVRYVRHEKNRSAFQARCTGAAAAKGDYVVPLDPDDYLMPETLAKLREVIDRDGADVVSYWIDCDDGKRIRPHWCRHPAGTVSAAEMLDEIVRHESMYSIVSKAVRRDAYLRAVDGLRLPPDAYVNTSEDFLITLAVVLCSRRITHLPYAGYRYCANASSITAGRRDPAGFRTACAQSRFAYEAVRSMAVRVAEPETVARVDAIVGLAERWFCREVLEGPAAQVRELSEILFENFHRENVFRAVAEGYASLKASRAYRVGRALSRILHLGE